MPRLSHAQVILYFVEAEACPTRCSILPWFGLRANVKIAADLAAIGMFLGAMLGLSVSASALHLLGQLRRAESYLAEAH